MKFFKLFVLSIVIAFTVGLFYWALFVPKEEISERIYKTLKEQEKRADLAFKQVSFEEVYGGEKYWELRSASATVNKSTGLATLASAEGTFFKKGKAVLKFRCPAALWDMKKKEIYLDKPLGYEAALERKISSLVKAVGRNPLSVFNLPKVYQKELGYWFQANNLSWKLADEKILCTGGIQLNKGEVTSFAEQLEGDVALERISLNGSPRIVITPEREQPVTVEAEKFEVLSAQDSFWAQGNPKISWGEAQVDSLQARYLQSERKLELLGNVRLKYKDITATGNTASYQTDTQQIKLKGNAFAEQGENKLSGDEVLVSLKDQKISLLGKSKVVITEEELKK